MRQKESQPGAAELTDAELIERTRAGDQDAYDQLYQRHHRAVLPAARAMVRNPSDVDDLIADAVTKTLAAIQRGHGPREAFRPYLLTTLRRTATDWAAHEQRLVPHDDLTTIGGIDASAESDALRRVDLSLAATAFAGLPERWQAVLWHTEVDGETPAQIAPILGLTPNAVAALAYRAREGLRQAYLQAHLARAAPACQPYADLLGGYVRDRLGTRERARLDTHLATCPDCTETLAELRLLNERLSALIGPAVLGGAAAASLANHAASAATPTVHLLHLILHRLRHPFRRL